MSLMKIIQNFPINEAIDKVRGLSLEEVKELNGKLMKLSVYIAESSGYKVVPAKAEIIPPENTKKGFLDSMVLLVVKDKIPNGEKKKHRLDKWAKDFRAKALGWREENDWNERVESMRVS